MDLFVVVVLENVKWDLVSTLVHVIKTDLVDKFRGTLANNQLYVIIGVIVFLIILFSCGFHIRNKNERKRREAKKQKREQLEEESQYESNTVDSGATAMKSPTKRRFSRLKDLSQSRENLLEISSK
eukprot:NODE_34_length_36538_cov_0.612854.p26 type:complete len:126 gc:universal NODE_34_length_36538_cov_0.612854:33874-33497(-)